MRCRTAVRERRSSAKDYRGIRGVAEGLTFQAGKRWLLSISMRSLKVNLIVALCFTLMAGALWAVDPYIDIFSSDSEQVGRAQEELVVESKARFGHRFFVGMQYGAGLSLIWVVYDLANGRDRRAQADATRGTNERRKV